MLRGGAILTSYTSKPMTDLHNNYVNFIMNSMSLKFKEETLYEYLLKDCKDLSEEELINEFLDNYGVTWFVENI